MIRSNLIASTLSVAALGLLSACAANGPISHGNNESDGLADLDIPYTRTVLENGLTVVVHEDHKAPLIAVNLWYHVGSKNEKPGKTGFAHLFEHLMFNGSENHDDEWFRPLEAVGATGMNGTTNEDRTNYFQTVPNNALDRILWMESDRMGHLLGAINQAKLDEQRGVVQNEKRQRENQPYGKVWNAVVENSYPPGHPYSWTVIGSMEDLEAASLDDVHQWFKDWYGPNNAVLVIAGDVNTEEAIGKVREYFGSFKPSPEQPRMASWVAELPGARRVELTDRVPQSRIYRVWNIPPAGDRRTNALSLAADVLGGGKTSRLYRELVHEQQLATGVSVSIADRELGSQLFVIATLAAGKSLDDLEAAIDTELAAFKASGPGKDELRRIRTGYRSALVSRFQRVGGFGGKSDLLARGEIYADNPGAWKDSLQEAMNLTPSDLQQAAQRWLGDNALTVTVTPQSELVATGEDVSRKQLPAVGPAPELRLPALQRAKLSNGLQVVLAERDSAPLVSAQLIFTGGYAADLQHSPGTASVTMSMLDEGLPGMDSFAIRDALDELGASISSSAGLDTLTVSVSSLVDQFPEALSLFSRVVREPSFPDDELQKLKPRWVAGIRQEKVQPVGMVLRNLPPLLYGEGHAYAQPLTGTGTEASVEKMQRSDLQAFHQKWMRPDNATLLVVGDTDLSTMLPQLEKAFGDWQAPATALPVREFPTVRQQAVSRIWLIDRPGSEQSMVIAGHLAPERGSREEVPLKVLNTILGGMFTSRLNLNLREDKHWSYGAGSFVLDTQAQRAWMAYASVQTDKTAASMREIQNEIKAIRGSRPASPEEIRQAQNNLTLKLPGQNETLGEVAGTIAEQIVYGLPDDYWTQYIGKVREQSRSDLLNTARDVLQPERLVWVVVGDLSKIEAELRRSGLGEVRILQAQ